MAGESARDQARRQFEKAARHKRAGERYQRGAQGERATAEALEPLHAQGWVVRHDVAWPARPRANIDHVAIGPGGVLVIDSKNWSGEVVVRDRVLRQNGSSRESAVDGVAEAARAVSAALGGVPVTGVLCFTGETTLEGWVDDVLVCSTDNVAELLAARPPTLHREAVDRFARNAIVALPPATGPRATKLKAANGVGLRTPRRRVALRSRSRRRRRSALVRFAVALGCLGVLAVAAPGLGTAVVDLFTKGLAPDVTKVGEAVEVPGTGARPELSVTVRSVDEMARAGGVKPAKGSRLVAVRVRFENTGSTPWIAKRVPDISIATVDGRIYHADPRLSVTAGGAVFPGRPRVKPGKALAGRVVVAVPEDAKAKSVTVTVDATSGQHRWEM
ncbi:NERD domain-containing protein [Nocardioides sp. Root151]|uniref:NERD domain-containing protein n=1 Tax=Nocardioides sp. Root151 TaxID=1736475 RepID=UPI0007026E59|nr:NERD domain-containing protein [Nocardioides sp. Root151]KQZ67133.1 hypothetical protein ASD66_19270 [Nocardioides sp. Root151]